MISTFKQSRDAEGRDVVELAMNAMIFKAAAIVIPLIFLAMAYAALGGGPMGFPWFMIVVPLVFAVIGYFLVGWICNRTKLRITIDGKAGKLLVDTAGGQSELRLADTAKAEFSAASGSEGSAVYRLEFVMKNGERVPATAIYANVYGPGDRAKTVAVINAALGKQMV